ncbi:Uncharacterised protein [Vibrio cholerae]|nr:Uncharacterised protein [Vibrio cholerae]CSD67867.1 Uncharacterised protein [Vibrio cholerae]CSD69239.1 Uncharacterised protein [Vibrio cholerae]CSI36465.1 Uncharacterised protein [Vibrio cholerae]
MDLAVLVHVWLDDLGGTQNLYQPGSDGQRSRSLSDRADRHAYQIPLLPLEREWFLGTMLLR